MLHCSMTLTALRGTRNGGDSSTTQLEAGAADPCLRWWIFAQELTTS